MMECFRLTKMSIALIIHLLDVRWGLERLVRSAHPTGCILHEAQRKTTYDTHHLSIPCQTSNLIRHCDHITRGLCWHLRGSSPFIQSKSA